MKQRRSHTTGFAQLTLVEHSLCPLASSQSLQPNLDHTTRFRYRDASGQRRTGTATTHFPRGFSSADEFHLWGMLALSLRESPDEPRFSATPHFILRKLGCIDSHSKRGGKNYRLFRESMERISVASYVNDSFYDPIHKEHDHRVFGFLKFRAPQKLSSDRLWHFYWDPLFFEYCSASGGGLRYDLGTYRSLDPASRRLFLLLHKIFYRRKASPMFSVRELMTHGIGYSDSLTNGERNRKLKQLATRLRNHNVIEDFGIESPNDRRREFTVSFSRGHYFNDLRERSYSLGTERSSLRDALVSLGFEKRDAGQICRRYKASMLREWIDITIAFEERNGAKAFRRSRKAYLIDNLKHAATDRRTPPDWWQDLKRRERRATEGHHDNLFLRSVTSRLSNSDSANSTSSGKTVPPIGDILRSIS